MKALTLKKGDIAVLAVILLAALIGLAVLAWQDGGAGLSAEVYQDGALIKTIALSSGERQILLENSGGSNLLLLSPQGIMMLKASCPNQDCVRCGLVNRPGGIIACLPHRLLVRLSGAKEGAFDAITY